MNSISHIKCSNCGVFNINKEYCDHCKTHISYQDKRKVRETETKKQEIKEAIVELERQNFIDKLRKHPFFLLKIVGWVLQSVWLIINIIGGLIAWFVAMVAAG